MERKKQLRWHLDRNKWKMSRKGNETEGARERNERGDRRREKELCMGRVTVRSEAIEQERKDEK